MYDIIIVGGGPSGSSAAYRASSKGLDVLIIEKEKFPRNKVCGGAVSTAALNYLDFKIPTELINSEVFGASIKYRKYNAVARRNERIAILVNRADFDNYLFEKSKNRGATVIEEEKVIDFKQNKDFIEVSTGSRKYKTRYLLLCNGCNYKLTNKIRKFDGKKGVGLCAEIKIPVEKIDKYNNFEKDIIHIYFNQIKMGYSWVFYHGGYYSIGVGALAKYVKHPKTHLINFLNNLSLKISESDKIKVALIPLGGKKRKLCTNKIFLCGDAAGFVDPFYGEGIAYAIKSGQIAADVIYEAKNKSNNKLVSNIYKKRCYQNFVYNFRYSLFFTKIAHKFPKLIISNLAEKPEYLKNYLDIPLRKKTYKQFIFSSLAQMIIGYKK